MNRLIKKTIAFILSLVLVLSAAPIFSFAAEDVVQTVFNFLIEEIKLTPAAACGVLANIEYESSFDWLREGDSGDSFGLCQWNTSRKDNLINYCIDNKLSYRTLDGQLQFLKYELSNQPWNTGYILNKIKNIDNTAQGAYDIAGLWCKHFEVPENIPYQSRIRGERARDYYWPKYGLGYNPTSLGDVNGDGKVDSSDSLLILKYTVGTQKLDSAQLKVADINADKLVNSQDSLIILRCSVGADNIRNYIK